MNYLSIREFFLSHFQFISQNEWSLRTSAERECEKYMRTANVECFFLPLHYKMSRFPQLINLIHFIVRNTTQLDIKNEHTLESVTGNILTNQCQMMHLSIQCDKRRMSNMLLITKSQWACSFGLNLECFVMKSTNILMSTIVDLYSLIWFGPFEFTYYLPFGVCFRILFLYYWIKQAAMDMKGNLIDKRRSTGKHKCRLCHS